MGTIAPNLSAAIGSEVAARLMGVAGGLLALSRIPACNIQVLGAKRKHLAGLSSSSANPHQGFVFQSAVVQSTPPPLRTKAARLVAAKCALLARVDAYGQDPSGAVRCPGVFGGGLWCEHLVLDPTRCDISTPIQPPPPPHNHPRRHNRHTRRVPSFWRRCSARLKSGRSPRPPSRSSRCPHPMLRSRSDGVGGGCGR